MGHAAHGFGAAAQLHTAAQLHARIDVENAKFNGQPSKAVGFNRGRDQSLGIDGAPIRIAHRLIKAAALCDKSAWRHFAEQSAAGQICRHDARHFCGNRHRLDIFRFKHGNRKGQRLNHPVRDFNSQRTILRHARTCPQGKRQNTKIDQSLHRTLIFSGLNVNSTRRQVAYWSFGSSNPCAPHPRIARSAVSKARSALMSSPPS